MSNILNFYSAGKKKTPHEYAGACPRCGGSDRFTIWPYEGKGGRFLCRGCGVKGDGISFLREFHSMTFQEACRALGQEPPDRLRLVQPPRPTEPKVSPLPCQTWQQAAAKFVLTCQRNLGHPEARATLEKRFITVETALRSGLGWNPSDQYFSRESWGLLVVEGRSKILQPKGLVIPTRRKSGIMALTVRTPDDRPEGRPRYWQAKGSANLPVVYGKRAAPVFLFESALDAALLWQEMQGQAAAVAFMGSTKNLDDLTRAFVDEAALVVACPDSDTAGEKAWQEWKKVFPFAQRISTPEAKDLTELAAKHGGAGIIQTWGELALKFALKQEARQAQNIIKTGNYEDYC